MTRPADVVIIGAGIVGASIAWHLARAGCRNVVLLERESRQGLGSTGKSMGGVRAQFATDVNIRLSMHSIRFYREFDQTLGHPAGYRAQGYLFLATRAEHLDTLRANHRRQRVLGLREARLITTAEAREVAPPVRMDDVLGASYCPTDGFVDPESVMQGFTERARELGVELRRGAEVTGMERDSSGIAGVHTRDEFIPTRAVVNAAGPWAAGVAAMAGVDLPVTPVRRMLAPTEACPELPRTLPMVVDMGTGFHFRPEGQGVLMAWNDPAEQPGFKSGVEPGFVEKILEHAAFRVPALGHVAVNPKRAWAGLYEVSPDHHAILGEAPGVPGFFLANGFSGHGVMHAPATGQILADLILQGKTGVIDKTLLALDRFARGRAFAETAVL